MKAMEIIDRVDMLEPNDYGPEQKLRWLSTLDGKVFCDVILTHEDGKLDAMPEYTNGNEELIIGMPHGEDVYFYYLTAMIAAENNENARYAKRTTQFNNAYQQWVSWYNRSHKPKSCGKQFV